MRRERVTTADAVPTVGGLTNWKKLTVSKPLTVATRTRGMFGFDCGDS